MPTNVLTPILKLDERNRWQPVTIGLLVKPPLPRRSIRMGRLQLRLVGE